MTERDRIWQSFLRTSYARMQSVADMEILCRWWFLRDVVKRRRQATTVEPQIIYIADAEDCSPGEFERLSAFPGAVTI